MGNKTSKSVSRQTSKSVTAKTQAIKSKGLWVIGKNESFELGIGTTKSISLKCVHKAYDIANIHIGNGHNLYSDTENRHIGVSGINSYQKDYRNLSKLSYFEDHSITLQRICVGLHSKTTFYITDDQRLFVNGCNDRFQAGLNILQKYLEIPTEITEIRGVSDVQSCDYYSVALCNVASTIIALWGQLCRTLIPSDVICLISKYCRTYTRIYITLYNKASEDKKLISSLKKSTQKWKEFKRMKGVTVTKIKTGFDHCLLLTSVGAVYSYGGNEYGQTGQQIIRSEKVAHSAIEMQKMPLMITYFRQYQKIKIKDIECGANFSMVLAENGKVFAFGNNEYGQLGNGKRTRQGFDENVSTPLMIQALEETNVTRICCGYFHGYARTEKGEHFLWGSNVFNECLTYTGTEYALDLHLINGMIHKKMVINKVYLGKHNTLFIVRKKSKNNTEPVWME